MRKQLIAVLVLFGVCFVGIPVHADEDEGELSPEDYLNEVLDIIEENAYFSDNIADWETHREIAIDFIRPGVGISGTYRSVRWTIQELRDGHSVFLTPEQLAEYQSAIDENNPGFLYDSAGLVYYVYEGSRADVAGVQMGDIFQPQQTITTDAGSVLLTFDRDGTQVAVEIQPEVIQSALLPRVEVWDDIGYVELFRLSAEEILEDYALTARELFDNDPDSMCGVIVDLRRNPGGNMWPMIVGVAPLLEGDNPLGSFVTREGEHSIWTYADNTAWIDDEVVFSLSTPDEYFSYAEVPVAILTSHITASSGEITLIAFKGLDRTRVFGLSTAGQSTANSVYELSDGALLALTTHSVADRNGVIYRGDINPDEEIGIDWTNYGSPDDPVIQAATDWLKTQCQ